MKTIKLFFLLVPALLCCIVLGSCDIQDYDIQIPERVFGRLNILKRNLNEYADLSANARQESRLFYESNLSFEYQVTGTKEQIRLDASIEKNRLQSVLSYKKDELGWVEASKLDIDLHEGYKGKMNILVEKHASTLKKKFDVSTISRIASILEGLPEMLYSELGKKEYMDESTLSIFYHLAAFNTAQRAYESRRSSDCQCEINPNYLSGQSPFFCKEDIIVSADWFYEIIKEKSEINKIAGQQFIPKSLYKYLKRESGQFVSASIVDKLLREDLKSFFNRLNVQERQQIINENFTLPMVSTLRTLSESDDELGLWGPLLCPFMGVFWGTQCGCCGNYDGPCLWCDTGCLIHDLACSASNCEPVWICFPGCKPGC